MNVPPDEVATTKEMSENAPAKSVDKSEDNKRTVDTAGSEEELFSTTAEVEKDSSTVSSKKTADMEKKQPLKSIHLIFTLTICLNFSSF